jgi:serine/threonine protein kinase
VNPDQPHDQWPAGVEVLEELGRGATSIVYRITKDGADYALKVLEATDNPAEVLAAFRREAALMATVRHPGLARIHDVGLIAGRPYLVLDLVPGRPLGEVLAERPLSPDAAISLAADVAGVLVAVHRRGLVHRDIKPHNIIIDPQGVAHLIDFGLSAREQGERTERTERTERAERAERADGAVGALAYAAPEQSETLRRAVDGRSDLYSLGVVIFESLTGRLPFRSDDVGELLRTHAVTPGPDRARLVPATPAALAGYVARLLAKDPDDRYPSASALLADLLVIAPELEKGLPVSVTTRPDPRDGPPGAGSGDWSGVDEPLSGRDQELAELSSRWESALRGNGGAALISGPAGGGKKRLARELTAALRAGSRGTGVVVLHAGCARDDQAPMTAIRSAVEEYARGVAGLPDTDREPVIDRLRIGAGSMTALLAGLSGTLAELLGGVVGLPDEDRQQQFQQGVAGFLAQLSVVSGGLLLVLDDVEWLDPGSLRVLELLTDRLASLPLMVIATAQLEPEHPDRLARFEAAVGQITPRLELQPLDVAGVRELLSAVLPGSGTTTALARLVAVRSDGNAFVVLEYLRAIIDAGLLRPTWGTWVLDEEGLDALSLPQDALGLVLKRVEGLGAMAERVLTAAAALGGVFRPDLVAQVCEVDEDVVLAVVAEAASRRLVERRDGGRVAFVHHQIREFLLQPVPAGTQAVLHARIATALESDPDRAGGGEYELARHHLASGRLTPRARLFEACVAAGRRALAEHDPAQAVTFFEHAFACGRPGRRTSGTHAVALARAGRDAEAVELLQEVLEAETGSWPGRPCWRSWSRCTGRPGRSRRRGTPSASG